jgi:hypothetical protein
MNFLTTFLVPFLLVSKAHASDNCFSTVRYISQVDNISTSLEQNLERCQGHQQQRETHSYEYDHLIQDSFQA